MDVVSETLPPRDSWPDLVYERPEFQYPEILNVATELLDAHVSNGLGDAPALLYEDERISYRELQRLTNQIGNVLLELGIQPGERVALRLPNRPIFVAAWLAIQKIGAVGVATMPMLRARELVYIILDCGVKVCLCAAELLDELIRARANCGQSFAIVAASPLAHAGGAEHSLEEMLAGASDELVAYPMRRDELALIAYTSGSTGVPKGTTHTPRDILAAADGYARAILQPTAGDIFSGHPTMAFTFGLGGLLVFPLRAGACSVLMERFSPELLLGAIARYRVTLLFCAATTYRMLLEHSVLENADLRSLRLCVSAGETLPAAVYSEWTKRTGVEVLDGIGATEMFHVFISSRSGSVRPGATGTPVPGYEAKIVDDQFEEVPRGSPGLLAVRGPTGCRYWRKPDLQRAYVRHGWNVTGDIYVQDSDGYFWYQCRNDDLIISGGYNIAPPEVERVLLEHAAVAEVAVVASPDPVRGCVPKAFVVLRPGATPSDDLAELLKRYVKQELAPYKYPREVEFLGALPKTETGKVRRAELRRRETERKAANP